MRGKSRFRESGWEHPGASDRDSYHDSRKRRISRRPVKQSKNALDVRAANDSGWFTGSERDKELSHQAEPCAYAPVVDCVPGMRKHVETEHRLWNESAKQSNKSDQPNKPGRVRHTSRHIHHHGNGDIGSDSPHPTAYADCELDKLEALHPKVIVPDHGAFPADAKWIGKEREYLQSLEARVRELKEQGKSAEQIGKLLTPELQGKYPDWSPPNNVAPAAQRFYSELP